MRNIPAWIAGLLIGGLGGFIVVEGSFPPRSITAIVAGVVVVLLGGFVLPSPFVPDATKRLLILAQPYIPVVFGGKRATDPPAAPPAAPPKAAPPKTPNGNDSPT